MATAPLPPTQPRRQGSLTAGMRRVAARLAAASTSPEGRPSALRYLALAMRIFVQVVRQWARDRCPQQAASLAFQSALSLVPMVAIALTLLRASGALEAESTLVQIL